MLWLILHCHTLGSLKIHLWLCPSVVLKAYPSVCYSRNEGHIPSGTLDLAPDLPTNLSLSYAPPLLLFFIISSFFNYCSLIISYLWCHVLLIILPTWKHLSCFLYTNLPWNDISNNMQLKDYPFLENRKVTTWFLRDSIFFPGLWDMETNLPG